MKKRDIRLNTEAHRGAFDDFADAFHAIEGREHWRSSEITRHWLDAAFRALRGRLLTGEAFDANETEYMRIVKHCQKPKETMSDLSVMLGCTASALAAEPVDFIGPIFETLAADAGMGQFFTPYSVSRMMAEMTIGTDPQKLIDGKGFISLCEPACGVGGMMLAANQVLRDRGVDLARHAHWVATDVDYRAVCGAFIQATLTECSATIIHGNTLSLETWMVAATPAALLYPKKFPDPPPAEPAPPPVPVPNKRGQFSFMFEPDRSQRSQPRRPRNRHHDDQAATDRNAGPRLRQGGPAPHRPRRGDPLELTGQGSMGGLWLDQPRDASQARSRSGR